MAKEFYTERDIEDMVKRGTLSLQVTDDVVLTELAYEKAQRLGMHLIHQQPMQPPDAPVRPYLSQIAKQMNESAPASMVSEKDLAGQIRNAVNAKLGSQVDPILLDAIIQRVIKSTGLK
jgi:hypothetical protein